MTKRPQPQNSQSSLFKGTMIYSGAHYTLCPVEIREIWAQGYALPDGPAVLRQTIADAMNDSGFEMVVISTCNRFDLCLFGQVRKEAVMQVFLNFAQWTISRVPALQNATARHRSWMKDVENWLRVMADEHALHHLFRVGASLDSLVLGEPHILGQLKDAFHLAVSGGQCHQEATLAFNRAFQVAKRVRTETDLGKSGVSIGHAAVEIVRRVFDNLGHHSCLILGAGEMAKITSQHLHACGAGSITIANRTLEKAEQLAGGIPNAKIMTLAQGLDNLGNFDVVIAATSAQEYIIRKELHSDKLNKRRVGTPTVLVDISVPRNIDPQLSGLRNIFVFDVDDLDKVMESSRKARQKAAQDAESIIQSELSEFISQRKQRESLTFVGQFHVLVKEIVQKEILKSLKSDPGMSEEQILITAEAVAKKLVAHPASLARTDARLDTDQDSVGQIMQYLFNLEPKTRGPS
ncbi:glutamyl-tRNA reductase [bacterium]|nr:glutamyl-tRNA reductase [bacterium]